MLFFFYFNMSAPVFLQIILVSLLLLFLNIYIFIVIYIFFSFAKLTGEIFLKYFIIFFNCSFYWKFLILYNALDRVLINGETFLRDNFLLRTFTGNINIAANSIVSKIMVVYLIIYTYKDKRLIYLSYVILFIAFSALFILLTRSAFLFLGLLT